ncbi:hypothetical protein VNO77_34362 [Canavalia gladiata]|uniref:Uncharacterized protein n=1 Tax=Canavalia gladiata TaxID=3824 RepID=A0AAN9KGL1_CANGL
MIVEKSKLPTVGPTTASNFLLHAWSLVSHVVRAAFIGAAWLRFFNVVRTPPNFAMQILIYLDLCLLRHCLPPGNLPLPPLTLRYVDERRCDDRNFGRRAPEDEKSQDLSPHRNLQEPWGRSESIP